MIQASSQGVDGLASLSSVWAVMEAARAGAADARSAAEGFLPAASKAITSGVHATGFAIGFAVSFPACMVARVVPRNNAIVYGLSDGGLAGLDLARSTVQSVATATPAPALGVVAS